MNSILPLQLMLVRGVGNAFIRRVADFITRYGETEGELVVNSVSKLTSTFRIKPDLATSIVNSRKTAESLQKQLLSDNIQLTWLSDNSYPNRLKTVLGNDAPAVLFYRGNLNICAKYAASFCGSRNVSAKGITITEECVKQLADKNIVIVSGYANGVDITAHRTAMQQQGETIIILAEGISHFREKREVKGLFNTNNHLIVSQFLPNTIWSGRNAMIRNSVIIGFSNAMVLIESGLTGGTYAAGNECLRRRHPLFVVDYKESFNQLANSELIQRGGLPIRKNHEGVPNLDRLLQTIYQNNEECL